MISRNLEKSYQRKSGIVFWKVNIHVERKNYTRNKHSFDYVKKSGMIVYRIMLYPKSTLSGKIQMANPMHPDAVTSGCDRGGSTTS